MATFPETIAMLESYGLVDVLLPFLLIFTIAFAVLQKSSILGDNRRPYNKVVAFVIALASIIPHVLNQYPAGADPIEIINRAIPNVGLVMVAGMMVLLLIGVFGKDVSFIGTEAAGFIVIAAFLVVAYIFTTSTGMAGLPRWLAWLDDPETQSLILTLLIFGIVIFFITKEPPRPEDKREPMRETINKLFGGALGKN